MSEKPTYEELEQRVKDLDKKLEESEYKRLWNTYSQSLIPTLILSQEGKIVDYNDAMAELTGFVHEEVPDIDAWMPKIYPDEAYRNKVMGVSNKSRYGEIDVKRDEFIITTKAGERRYVEFSVFDISHEGKPMGMQVVQGVDITEKVQTKEELRKSHIRLEQRVKERTAELGRKTEQLEREIERHKRAEEALQENEERFRLLFETMESGFALLEMIYDKNDNPIDCRYVTVNPSHQNLTGLNPSEIIGKTAKEVLGRKDKLIQKYGRIDKSGESMKIEEYMERLGKWFSLIVYRPKPGFIAVLSENITKRKLMEEALRESEERYKTLIENAVMAIYQVTRAGQFIMINQRMAELIGYDSPKEFLGAIGNVIELYAHPEDRTKFLEEIDEKGFVEGREEEFKYKDGKSIWVKLNTRASTNKEGIQIFEGLIEDITERKRAEEERRQLTTQLQQAKKMEAIGTLAGGIAHQFNNALSPLSVNLDMLEMDYPGEKKIANYTKQMKDSSHRMAQLTNQLLAYARGGKYQAKIISPSDFVRETLPLIRHTIHPDVDVDTDLPRDILPIKVDFTQLQMVLTAVMQNAAEAIDGKGLIKVYSRAEVIGEVSDNNHPGLKPGSYISIAIEDDGKGMDEETRGRIFEPFFTTKFQGRGLGMAAAYGIIKNHDGWISVESELGKGTVVRLYLPATEVEVKELKEPKPVASKSTGTILVIEDEKIVMDVSRSLLERLGYRVLEARTGKEAVKIAKTFDGDIDLAVLDIFLPDMNGKDIYPLIMEVRPTLKVLVCSGYSIDGPAQEILTAGAEGFLQKPFSISALSEKLMKVMKSK